MDTGQYTISLVASSAVEATGGRVMKATLVQVLRDRADLLEEKKETFGTDKRRSKNRRVPPSPLFQKIGLGSRPCSFGKGRHVPHLRRSACLEAVAAFALCEVKVKQNMAFV